jgi:hypothetical protein
LPKFQNFKPPNHKIKHYTEIINQNLTYFLPIFQDYHFLLVLTLFYCSILDLAVDVTGLANRDTGAYSIMRSGGLGYFYGGGDDSVCKSLHSDLLNHDSYCDNEGAYSPIAMLNPINQHQLGKTVRIGGDGPNPLMDRYISFIHGILIEFFLSFTRTRNPNAMQTASFEWTDLLEPTKMLCKVDNYMSAVNGHIDVTTDPDSYVSFGIF